MNPVLIDANALKDIVHPQTPKVVKPYLYVRKVIPAFLVIVLISVLANINVCALSGSRKEMEDVMILTNVWNFLTTHADLVNA